MLKFIKNIILFQIALLIAYQNAVPQNTYGWERILNSIHGINGFYKLQSNYNTKLWMARPIGDLLGTGKYEFIKYNSNFNSWYPASHSIFRGVYYSYLGGPIPYWISGYALPNVFAISPRDSNLILINTVIPHDFQPPYDLRLLCSYDNGNTKNPIEYFQIRSFTGLAINPKNDSIIYAASSDTIFKSIDRGISWSAISRIQDFNGTLSINPFNTNIIYAYNVFSLFISMDSGNSFNSILDKKFTELTFNFSDSSILTSFGNIIYKSDDGGFNWMILDSLQEFINVLDFDPDDYNAVYAGTVGGLYKSTTGGTNFYLYNNSFTPSRKVIGICKEANQNFIYVSTEEAIYKCWNSFVVGINNSAGINPKAFILYQNFPNPFNPVTTINYELSESKNVTIKVFDILGKQVITLVNENKNPGNHSVDFDAGNYSSGIYFYTLEADGFMIDTKKMILLK